MTAELAFAQTFLTTLDSKPTKRSPDYAADLKTLVITSSYTLPRLANAKPMLRPTTTTTTTGTGTGTGTSITSGTTSFTTTTSAPGTAAERTVLVTLKSKNPALELRVPGVELGVSVLELKNRVAAELGLGSTEKVRLLWKRKPVGDAKTVGEMLDGEVVESVEVGVMIIGGLPAAAAAGGGGESAAVESVPVAQGVSGEDVLVTEAFWSDLGGFLEQRIRDQGVADRTVRLFREAWKDR